MLLLPLLGKQTCAKATALYAIRYKKFNLFLFYARVVVAKRMQQISKLAVCDLSPCHCQIFRVKDALQATHPIVNSTNMVLL